MSSIYAFKNFQTYELLEKFGIINLEDPKYQKDIQDITKTIVQNIKSNNHIYTTLPYFNYPLDSNYIQIFVNNKCNIDKIQILIKNMDSINANICDCFILSNQQNIKDGYFKYNEKLNKIEFCTIVLQISFTYWYNNIDRLIEHELKHLYDLLQEYKGKTELMNKDISFSDTIKDYYQLPDMSFTIPDLKKINDNYKTDFADNKNIIIPLMSDMLYYMNKSEISARLLQIKYKEHIEETINLYKEYNRICDNIITYASDNIKKHINTDFIIDSDYSSIYGLNFNLSNNAYISNVKKLFEFYKKRIKHFIIQAHKLLSITESVKTKVRYGGLDPMSRNKITQFSKYW